jgi:DNA (cytosine-5)-methyltransferase 1
VDVGTHRAGLEHPERRRLVKAVSLFSGVGGFDLGFERAGIETVLQAERDPHCLKVLERHWPQTERVTDVRDVTHIPSGSRCESRDPARVVIDRWDQHGIDLVYGGFPCQDLSVAGKRAGLGGERSGLWYEFHRVLSELRPRWTVIENVPGLLSSNGGLDFAVLLNGLEELGYGWAYGVLDAQFFGVPQRRRRVFIVGCLGDQRRAAQVLAVCESCGGNPETGREAGERVATDAQEGAGIFESRFARNGRGAPSTIAPPLKAENGQTGKGDGAPLVFAIQDGREIEKDQNGLGISEGIAYTLDGTGAQAVANPLGSNATGGFRFDLDHDTYIPEVAYTIAAREAKGVSLLESQTNYSAGVRRLTPLECERLQGFPEGWTEGQSDSHRYRQMGNAVCVPVAEWIGHRIVAIEKARVAAGLEAVR